MHHYGILLCVAFGAGYLGVSYIGLGIDLGVLFAIAYSLASGRSDPPFGLGITILLIGITGFAMTYYLSKEYGMSFDELYRSRPISRFGRRFPLYTVTALTTGILLISYTALGKLNKKYD